MNLKTLVFLLLPLTATARDMRPSLGFTYSRLDLSSSDRQPGYMPSGMHRTDATVDLRWPVCDWLDLGFAGGPSTLEWTTWTPTFQLQTVTQDQNGNIFGTYGVSGRDRRRTVLTGYNLSASFRVYLK